MPSDAKEILLVTDCSAASRAALETARELARCRGASLTLLYVVETPTPYALEFPLAASLYLDAARAGAEAELETLARPMMRSGVRLDLKVFVGSPYDVIVAYAGEAEPAVIVLEARGQTGFKRPALGSVAEHVARAVRCPVLVVPARRAEGEPRAG